MALLYIILFLLISYLIYLLVIIFLPVLNVKQAPFNKELKGREAPEQRESVKFLVKNTDVSAWYYTPTGGKVRGCIIMSHGFNGTKDCLLEDYALEFVNEGYSVLTYDYRTYGESGGEPRQMLSLPMQYDDLRGAVKFIKVEKSIEKIYLWGTSAGATHGLVVASEDRDIKGVICQCGAYDSKLDSKKGMKDNGLLFYLSLIPHAVRDKWRGRLGLSRHMIPAYGKSSSRSFIRSDSIFTSAEKLGRESKNFINVVCAGFILEPHGPKLLEVAYKIKCPVLILVCEKDEIISSESHLGLCTILEDKVEVFTLPISHFDIYHGQWFNKSVMKEIEFLSRNSGYDLTI